MYDDLVNKKSIREEDSKDEIEKKQSSTKKTLKQQNTDELAGGKFVKTYSANFDLIINILINIRRSLSNLVEMPGINVDKRLFEQKITTITDYVSREAKNDPMFFKFTDFAPFIFQKIRQRRKISEEEYMKSLGPEQILNSFWTNNFDTLYELCSSGQSGALFYFTKDKNYMMKTIPKREFESLKNVLEAYLSHMLKYNDSMITTFFGMHEITWGKYRSCSGSRTSYIVVMNNIFKDFTVGNRWDLKGSS